MTWQEYQQQAARFFRSLGLKAQVEAKIEGVRGIHEIDVFVTGNFHGIDFKWAIKCKAWQSNVPKEKVLAFASVIQDVGADRGFLLSEQGFQSGAIRMAQKSNITLTSLEDLANLAEEQAVDAAIGSMNWRLQKARNRLRVIKKEKFDDEYMPPTTECLGELMILESVLQDAHQLGFPVRYYGELQIESLDGLLQKAEQVISKAENWQPPEQV